MQISIIVVMGERKTFNLSEVGPCFPDDDVIYFAGVACVLSSAEPAPETIMEHQHNWRTRYITFEHRFECASGMECGCGATLS